MLDILLPGSIILASLIMAFAVIYTARPISRAIAGKPGLGSGAPGVPNPDLELPQSEQGFPVEPSGIAVSPETRLEIGSTVLACSQGRWWRAEVVSLDGANRVRIHYPGWDSLWDETVPRRELQVDLTESVD